MSLSELINNAFGLSSHSREEEPFSHRPFEQHFTMFPRMFSGFDDRKGDVFDRDFEGIFKEADAMMNQVIGRHGLMDESRFQMLQGPEQAYDRDYDDIVKKNGIKALMDPTTEKGMTPIDSNARQNSSPSSFFQTKSYSRSTTGDGRVHEVKKYKDSQGNHFESKARTVDGKTYAVIDKKTASGQEEHLENFYNMDGADVNDFERRWKEKPSKSAELMPGSATKSITDGNVSYDDNLGYKKKEEKKGILDYFKSNFLKKD